MRKIVITNVYGMKNIGDAAIQESAFVFLDDVLTSQDDVSVLSESGILLQTHRKHNYALSFYQLPYGHAIRSKDKPASYVTKILRFLSICIGTFLYAVFGKINRNLFPNTGFYQYVRVIVEADYIIGMGGGYFITQHIFLDYFGLILNLLPIYVAKLYRKPLLFLPLTFGPFASDRHKLLVQHALNGTTVMCRDQLSVKAITSNLPHGFAIKTMFMPDLALYYPNPKDTTSQKNKRDCIALTVREWLPLHDQENYEQQIALFITKLWEQYKLKTRFLPMAWNVIEDNDSLVAHRLAGMVADRSIFHIEKVTSPLEAQIVLSQSKIAVCNRLHSAILATTVNTPFICMGYGIKTKGFLEWMKLEQWNIDMEKVTAQALLDKVSHLLQPDEYEQFAKQETYMLTHAQRYKKEIIQELRIFTGSV